MVGTVSCPKCGKSVNPQDASCKHCGVNLALAALLAERKLTTGSLSSDRIPISPEILVPLLGDYLIQKNVLSSADLEKALLYQADLGKVGKTQLIGQTLLDLGFISKETLDQAITEQIIELQSALQRANSELEMRVRERTIELENALNRLAELNQLKSNFIANISHELRTPLTHLRGYIELFIDSELGPLTIEQSNALSVMKKSEERLEQLIENLIQFSLYSRGEMDLMISVVDVNQLLADITSEAVLKCKNSELTLKTTIPKYLPQVEADYQKIQWVVSQLVDNAAKFTPPGGIVEIKVQGNQRRVTLSVLDSGIGISHDRYEEIFEPFHQLDSSATRRYGGTGLGLTMVKEIIEAHGSKINVISKPGDGSFFSFSLPVSNQ